MLSWIEWKVHKMKKAERFEEMIGVFSQMPLNEDNFAAFYVDTTRVRSVINARNAIVKNLKYGINPYTKLLFMGHKGCGKSTEILQISENLKDQYEIINFSVAQEVELRGIQYIDVIFAIISQIIEYIKKSQMITISENTLDKLIKYWTSEVMIEENGYDNAEIQANAEGKISFLSFISLQTKGVLKTGSESKQSIRRSVEPKVSYLINMINNILGDINEQLQSKKAKELLVVIEDLDKLDMADARHIFVEHRKTILSIRAKMILSFPIYMAYTADFGMISDDVDDCVLYSMIKVSNRDGSRNEDGISILKEIVAHRMNMALIEADALDYIIRMSGGAIRDIFSMLVDCVLLCLDDEEQPKERITMREATYAEKKLKSTYERYINSKEQFDRLVEVYREPCPERTDEILSELLKTLSVIEYNGDRWCGVHPVLQEFLNDKGIQRE